MTSAEGRQVTVRYARDPDVLGIAVMVGGPVNVGVQTLAPSSLFKINAPSSAGTGTDCGWLWTDGRALRGTAG